MVGGYINISMIFIFIPIPFSTMGVLGSQFFLRNFPLFFQPTIIRDICGGNVISFKVLEIPLIVVEEITDRVKLSL